MFWGLTPLTGLQSIGILTTHTVAARVLRREASLFQAFVWYWVNNPVTMVPMYYLFYLTGLWLLGDSGIARGYDSFGEFWTRPELSWSERVGNLARAVGVATVLGCVPYAFGGAALAHRWSLAVVRRRRRRLRERRATLAGPPVAPSPGPSL